MDPNVLVIIIQMQIINNGCQYIIDECGICGGNGLSFTPPESYYDCNGNCINDF